MVSLTTSKKHYDPTCVFHDGEGKLIIAGSWVYYAKAKIEKLHMQGKARRGAGMLAVRRGGVRGGPGAVTSS